MVAQDKGVADSAPARKAVVGSTIRKRPPRVEDKVKAMGISDLEDVLNQIRDNHFHRIDLHLFLEETLTTLHLLKFP